MKALHKPLQTVWKSVLLLCVLLVALTSTTPVSASNNNGYRLMIYYGIPIEINETGTIEDAALQFAKYDYIVLGAGLEETTHEAHNSTASIIAQVRKLKPSVHIYGYIDLGVTTDNLSISTIQKKTVRWKTTGADGIFFDDAGFDYGVTRKRLNQAVQYVHSQSLKAFINAWKPDDIMSSAVNAKYNPKGEKTAIGGGDLYLLESMLQPVDIPNQEQKSVFGTGFRSKMDKALMYRNLLGVKLMSISPIDYGKYSSDAVRKFFRANEAAAAIFSLDGYGIAPKEYSTAANSHNALREMPYILNYMDYYTTNVAYVAKYNDCDFASRDFRLHSLPGEHFYDYPVTVVYE
ncbi:hypothetical protein PaecuDRAFT_2453 [Paenibacillus curdlanolyticus YK9]|uniref:Uncharacterized protein n=1 Tax=Paenibacillus curdlanolyticus YK9 TaxID=717606 RepID=E0I9W6_9BACL|nr:hypothetical protein [Paenibacillus curdlanolyticus]EFM10543.1 hypothetical protein PaecuDRAFT_2453 [Paenibacillus curdlanolyticus YK9]